MLIYIGRCEPINTRSNSVNQHSSAFKGQVKDLNTKSRRGRLFSIELFSKSLLLNLNLNDDVRGKLFIEGNLDLLRSVEIHEEAAPQIIRVERIHCRNRTEGEIKKISSGLEEEN
jgi:hypothetical protein